MCVSQTIVVVFLTYATLSVTINGNNILIPDDVGLTDEVCPDGMRGVHTYTILEDFT